VTRVIAALLVLGSAAGLLGACTGAARQKAAEDARVGINRYCDDRQKMLDTLGTGDAGAAP